MSRRLTQEEILMPDATLIFTPRQWSQMSEEAKEAVRAYAINSFSKGENIYAIVSGYRVAEIEEYCRKAVEQEGRSYDR